MKTIKLRKLNCLALIAVLPVTITPIFASDVTLPAPDFIDGNVLNGSDLTDNFGAVKSAVDDNNSRITDIESLPASTGLDDASFTSNITISSTASTLTSQTITAPANSNGGFILATFTGTADISISDSLPSTYVITQITEDPNQSPGSGDPSFTYNWYPGGQSTGIYIFTVSSSKVIPINAGESKTFYVRARTDNSTNTHKFWSGQLTLLFVAGPRL